PLRFGHQFERCNFGLPGKAELPTDGARSEPQEQGKKYRGQGNEKSQRSRRPAYRQTETHDSLPRSTVTLAGDNARPNTSRFTVIAITAGGESGHGHSQTKSKLVRRPCSGSQTTSPPCDVVRKTSVALKELTNSRSCSRGFEPLLMTA